MSSFKDALAKVDGRMAAALGRTESFDVMSVEHGSAEHVARVLLADKFEPAELEKVLAAIQATVGATLACQMHSENPAAPVVAVIAQFLAAGIFHGEGVKA